MKGGYRAGAGRKKGFASIEAEKARDYIAQKVSASLEPIISNLIKQAKEGNIQAAKELFDRSWGRSLQSVDLKNEIQLQIPIMRLPGRELVEADSLSQGVTP